MSEVTNLEIRDLILTFEKFVKADWRKQSMFGMKPSEIRMLLQIKDISQQGGQGVTISDISRCLMVTSPTVTQLIKSLNHNGFIEKTVDTHDRRVSDIKLTSKGEDIVEKVRKRRVALFTGLIESMGKEQTVQLISLLDQVYDYLDEMSKEY